MRVPTWVPFRLQVYFNGHNALAAALGKAGIGYAMEDNAFVSIDDFAAAQKLADSFDVKKLHRKKTIDLASVLLCFQGIKDFVSIWGGIPFMLPVSWNAPWVPLPIPGGEFSNSPLLDLATWLSHNRIGAWKGTRRLLMAMGGRCRGCWTTKAVGELQSP